MKYIKKIQENYFNLGIFDIIIGESRELLSNIIKRYCNHKIYKIAIKQSYNEGNLI